MFIFPSINCLGFYMCKVANKNLYVKTWSTSYKNSLDELDQYFWAHSKQEC